MRGALEQAKMETRSLWYFFGILSGSALLGNRDPRTQLVSISERRASDAPDQKAGAAHRIELLPLRTALAHLRPIDQRGAGLCPLPPVQCGSNRACRDQHQSGSAGTLGACSRNQSARLRRSISGADAPGSTLVARKQAGDQTLVGSASQDFQLLRSIMRPATRIFVSFAAAWARRVGVGTVQGFGDGQGHAETKESVVG